MVENTGLPVSILAMAGGANADDLINQMEEVGDVKTEDDDEAPAQTPLTSPLSGDMDAEGGNSNGAFGSNPPREGEPPRSSATGLIAHSGRNGGVPSHDDGVESIPPELSTRPTANIGAGSPNGSTSRNVRQHRQSQFSAHASSTAEKQGGPARTAGVDRISNLLSQYDIEDHSQPVTTAPQRTGAVEAAFRSDSVDQSHSMAFGTGGSTGKSAAGGLLSRYDNEDNDLPLPSFTRRQTSGAPISAAGANKIVAGYDSGMQDRGEQAARVGVGGLLSRYDGEDNDLPLPSLARRQTSGAPISTAIGGMQDNMSEQAAHGGSTGKSAVGGLLSRYDNEDNDLPLPSLARRQTSGAPISAAGAKSIVAGYDSGMQDMGEQAAHARDQSTAGAVLSGTTGGSTATGVGGFLSRYDDEQNDQIPQSLRQNSRAPGSSAGVESIVAGYDSGMQARGERGAHARDQSTAGAVSNIGRSSILSRYDHEQRKQPPSFSGEGQSSGDVMPRSNITSILSSYDNEGQNMTSTLASAPRTRDAIPNGGGTSLLSRYDSEERKKPFASAGTGDPVSGRDHVSESSRSNILSRYDMGEQSKPPALATTAQNGEAVSSSGISSILSRYDSDEQTKPSALATAKSSGGSSWSSGISSILERYDTSKPPAQSLDRTTSRDGVNSILSRYNDEGESKPSARLTSQRTGAAVPNSTNSMLSGSAASGGGRSSLLSRYDTEEQGQASALTSARSPRIADSTEGTSNVLSRYGSVEQSKPSAHATAHPSGGTVYSSGRSSLLSRYDTEDAGQVSALSSVYGPGVAGSRRGYGSEGQSGSSAQGITQSTGYAGSSGGARSVLSQYDIEERTQPSALERPRNPVAAASTGGVSNILSRYSNDVDGHRSREQFAPSTGQGQPYVLHRSDSAPVDAAHHSQHLSPSDFHHLVSLGGLDPEVLAALPEDVRNEIIEHEKQQRLVHRRSSAPTTPAPNEEVARAFPQNEGAAISSSHEPSLAVPAQPSSATNSAGLVCPPGMDQDVFQSLPPEMQRECIRDHERLLSLSGMDPEVFAALPDDVRREIIAQEHRNRHASGGT